MFRDGINPEGPQRREFYDERTNAGISCAYQEPAPPSLGGLCGSSAGVRSEQENARQSLWRKAGVSGPQRRIKGCADSLQGIIMPSLRDDPANSLVTNTSTMTEVISRQPERKQERWSLAANGRS